MHQPTSPYGAGQQPAPPDPVVPPPRWGLLDALGSLLGFVVLSLAASIGLAALGLGAVTAGILATPIGWVALAGWPLVASRRRGNGPRSDLAWRFRSVDVGIGVLAGFVVLGAALVFAIVYVGITGEPPTSALGDAAEGARRDWQIVGLAGLALVAPFVEELHFRGMWWSALRRRGLRPWPTLVITALLFAVVHFEPTRAPLLFAAGLAAGFVRMITHRLGPALVTHLVVNAVGVIGLLTLL